MIETGDDSSENLFCNVPPPPPLPHFLNKNEPIQGRNSSDNFQEDEFQSYEKAVKRVTETDTFLHAKPILSYYTHLKSQLQQGPKCGLVALSIATSKTDCFKSADELFAEALSQLYTTKGEMYSCKDLADLAEMTTQFKTRVIEGGIDFHIECIFHCIRNGGLMLIPYDADFNHSPCCKGGRKAHWAVVSGIVVFRLKEESGSEGVDGGIVDGEGCLCLRNEIEFSGNFPDGDKVRVIGSGVAEGGESPISSVKGKVYLAAKHGKSLHLALWPLDRLAESNSNLNDISDEQKRMGFVLPQAGVASGIKGKAILLTSKRG